MTLQEIKNAVENGKTVCWDSEIYEVKKDKFNQWHIICSTNDSAIGLTHQDQITMNGKPEEFFINEKVNS